MTRLRLVLGNLAILLALLLLSAGVGEVALRLSATPNDQRVEGDGHVKYRFNPYRADGLLGWSHRPDWETVHETGNFRVAVRTDARGLRLDPSPKAPGDSVYRILVLGDSFAFGWGVEDDETFAVKLASALEPPPGIDRVEVLNAGVAGWSADHYGLFLKERGLDLEPDLILVAPSENDLSDLAASRMTVGERGLPVRTASALRMIDRNGRMRYVQDGPYALPSFEFPGQAWLAEQSSLYHWLRYRLARVWVGRARSQIEESQQQEAGEPPSGPIAELTPEEIARGLWTGRHFQLAYHQYLMEDLERVAAERGIPLRTLFVTRKAETEPETSVLRSLRAACLEDAACVPSDRLLAGHDPADVFFPHDGHWTPRGHEVIAQGLAGFLEPLPVR